MTIPEERKFSMYLTARDYNINGGTAVTNIVNMTGFQASLVSNCSQIQIIREAQEVDKSGIAENKGILRVELEKKTLDIVKKVTAYAVFTNNTQLGKEAHYTKSKLENSSDTILRDKCQVVYGKANANIANLGTYGVTAATLTALQAAITSFNNSIPKPRLGTLDTKQATIQLKALFKSTDAILIKMDAMYETISQSNENLYKGYKSARIIIVGHSLISIKGKAVDMVTKEVIKNVVFDFMPENVEQFKMLHKTVVLKKKTAKMGGFYLKSLPVGTYTVTIMKKGYVTQTQTVNVIDGETMKLNVEMIKE